MNKTMAFTKRTRYILGVQREIRLTTVVSVFKFLPSFMAQNLRKSSLKLDSGGGSSGIAVLKTIAGGGDDSPKSSIMQISKWLNSEILK